MSCQTSLEFRKTDNGKGVGRVDAKTLCRRKL